LSSDERHEKYWAFKSDDTTHPGAFWFAGTGQQEKDVLNIYRLDVSSFALKILARHLFNPAPPLSSEWVSGGVIFSKRGSPLLVGAFYNYTKGSQNRLPIGPFLATIDGDTGRVRNIHTQSPDSNAPLLNHPAVVVVPGTSKGFTVDQTSSSSGSLLVVNWDWPSLTPIFAKFLSNSYFQSLHLW